MNYFILTSQLLDWLIGYGVKQVLAVGSCGSLEDFEENEFVIPTKAIRDEGLANPNRLKEVKLSHNPLSYIDSVKKNTTSGLMISSGLGGGTANMEYMTLTGLPV
ncbi:phosphorylase family protein, partial [Limosilactobacillus fermentum]|uniref:phosphorylase family protein n=1 Tax=Limosilactobacillus fermentum TaxID=1613 RepID=UPI003F67E237